MIRTILILLISLWAITSSSQVATNGTCADAIEIFCGDLVSGTTEGIDDEFIFTNCFSTNGPAAWYRLVGDGSVNVFSYVSSTADFLLIDILSSDCNSQDASDCRGQFFFSTQGDSLSLQTEPGEEIFIAITPGCCNDFYDFEIILECQQPVDYDQCSNARPIVCQESIELSLENATSGQFPSICQFEMDQDLWLTFEGDNMIHVFEPISQIGSDILINVYTGTCEERLESCPVNNLEFNYDFPIGSFFASIGNTYILRVSSPSLDIDTFQLNHFCMMPTANDLCENAQEINCGISLTGNTVFASSTNQFNGCVFESQNDEWFSIIGDDMVHEFSPDSIQNSFHTLEIYQESCSLNYTACRQSFFLEEESSVSFLAESGTIYNIRITANEGFYDISHNCRMPLENDNCENPESLVCNQTFENNLLFATPDFGEYPCDFDRTEQDLWYEIIGDDQIHTIQFDSVESNVLQVEIIVGTCDTGDCFETFNLFNGDAYSFFAESGNNYVLRIFMICCYGDEGFFRLTHECSVPAENDSCDSAELWECGTSISGTTNIATFDADFEGCNFAGAPDLWYLIQGDDLVHSISVLNGSNQINIYQQSCDEGFNDCEILFNTFIGGGGYNFFAESGQNYLIQLSNICCSNPVEFNLMQECFPPIENDFCSDAIVISCNAILNVQTSNASPTLGDLCFSDEDQNDVWFELAGDGLFHSFEITNQNSETIIEVFNIGCDLDENDCPIFRQNTFSDLNNFLAEIGTTYLIRIYSFDGAEDIPINHICQELAENNSCETAEAFTCGESIIGNTLNVSETTFINDNCLARTDRAQWYTIEGDGMIHQFEIEPGIVDHLILVFLEEGCDVINGECFVSELNTFGQDQASFLLDENITYHLRIAGRFDDGSFEVSHNCFEPASNDVCVNAMPITCNTIISGNTSNTQIDPPVGCSLDNAADLWYFFEGDGSLHNFNFLSSETGCIRVEIFEGSCPLDFEQCNDSQQLFDGSIFNFLSTIGTDYLVRVSTCFDEGSFELEHSCDELAPNDLCENAQEILCGEPIIGNTDFAFHSDGFNGCTFENTNDLWYSITGDDNTHILSSLDNSFNLSIDLYQGSCSNDQTNCVTTNINLGISNNFSFFAAAGTNYILRVYSDSFNGPGPFSFNHQCGSPPINDECENAIMVDCNISDLSGDLTFSSFNGETAICANSGVNDVWFTINGDGLLHSFFYLQGEEIDLEIYENSCDENVMCNNPFYSLDSGQDPVRIITDINTTYLIRISSRSISPSNEFSILHMCMDPVENDRCEDAIAINCGESFSGDFELATFEDVFNGCATENESDLWYRLQGDDQIHFFTLLDNETNGLFTSNIVSIEIYMNDCSIPRMECGQILRFALQGITQSYFFEAGTDYFLRVSKERLNSNFSFVFNHECLPFSDNDECDNAIALACGDTIEGNTTTASINEETDNCSIGLRPDIWYSITGDGLIHTFELIEVEFFVVTISFFENDCDNSVCLFDRRLTNSSNLASFEATLNTNYLINISVDFQGPGGEFALEYTCNEAVENDACENAIPIACGEPIDGTLLNSSSTGFRNDCINESSNDVWYTFTGDGNVHIFGQLEPEFDNVFLEIYDSSCSDRFDSCPMEFIPLNDNSNSQFFIAENGVDYLIRVIGINGLPSFLYSYSCEDPMAFGVPQNDDCTDAIAFGCGETLQVDVSFATLDNDHELCGSISSINLPGLWYTFTGDGSTWELNTLATENAPIVFVFEETCLNTNCTEENYNFLTDRVISIDTEIGLDYFVLIRSSLATETEIVIDVNCIEPQTNDLCDSPTDIICGSEFRIDFTDVSQTNLFNGCTDEDSPDVWYTFTGTGEYLTIESTPESVGPTLVQFFQGECSNINSCDDVILNGNGDGSSSGSFLTTPGIDYLIRISGNRFSSGIVELIIDCLPPSTNDFCTNPQDIQCDELIEGNFLTATRSGENTGCTILDTEDLWYTLVGDGQVHAFSSINSNEQYPMEIYVDPCINNGMGCEQFLIAGFSNANNTFFAQAGVKYNIRVFNFGSNNSDFSIIHACGDAPPNDECLNAMPITCQDTIVQNLEFSTISLMENSNCENPRKDVWYSIEGTDQFLLVDLLTPGSDAQFHRIFAGTCTPDQDEDCPFEFTLIDNLESYTFFIEEGITYYINASTSGSLGNSLFTTACIDPPPNDECEDALPLNCGEVISGNTRGASFDPVFLGCNFFADPDMWYSITGDDLHHTFEYIPIAGSNYTVDIYEGSCNNFETNCVTDFSLNESSLASSFFAESGTDYFVRISGFESGEFSFLHNCLESADNDLCEQAIVINCNETVSINLLNSTYTPLFSDCQAGSTGDIWYRVSGMNQIITLSTDSSINTNTEVEIYTQECTNKYTCFEQFEFSDDVLNQGFFAKQGISYYLRIYSDGSSILTPFNLSLQCGDIPDNTSCDNAITISCNETIIGSTIGLESAENIFPCNTGFTGAPAIWYTLTGDNQIQTVQIQSPDVRPYASLYNSSCDLQSCTEIDNFISNTNIFSFSFTAERDSVYYLVVSSRFTSDAGVFNISLDCEPIPENNFAAGAQEVSCGENIQGTIVNASPSELTEACEGESPSAAGVWYTYESFGDSLELIFNELGFVPTVSLFEVVDGGLFCVEQQSVTPTNNSLNTCAMSSLPSFDIPCMEADLNSFCVPIFVENMEDLVSLSLSISYDTSFIFTGPTVSNYFGGTNTGNDFENGIITIDWGLNNNNSIVIDESIPYFVQLCFEATDNSPDQLELNFTEESFVTGSLFDDGSTIDRESCSNSGIVYQTGSGMACDEVLSALFTTQPDTEYFIHISGSNEFDSGGFDFTMNCQEEIIVQEIPTMGEWGIIILTLLMLIFGVVSIKSGAVVKKKHVI